MGVLYEEKYILQSSIRRVVQLTYLLLLSSQLMAWQLQQEEQEDSQWDARFEQSTAMMKFPINL